MLSRNVLVAVLTLFYASPAFAQGGVYFPDESMIGSPVSAVMPCAWWNCWLDSTFWIWVVLSTPIILLVALVVLIRRRKRKKQTPPENASASQQEADEDTAIE